MTAEQTYLAWMRFALWDSPDGPANDDLRHSGLDPESLSAMLTIADRQKTRGLIFDALLRDTGSASGMDRERMRQFLLQTFSTHRMLDAALSRAVQALRAAGIPAVLLKGQGAARAYPNPLLRECGDIDLYIGPERLEEAVRVLTPLATEVGDGLHGKHWEVYFGEAEIELHRDAMIPEHRRLRPYYRTLEADGLSRGLVPLDFGGVRVDTPEPTFGAFYLFYHAWHHFVVGGIGFRQLCDWTLHLHVQRATIDRERLLAMLHGMHLLRPWQLLGCIVVHDLGLPQEELPGYRASRLRASRRVLRMILREGNFGRGVRPRRPRPKGYLASKTYSFIGHIRRFCQVFPIAPGDATRVLATLTVTGFRRVLQDLLHPE